MRLAIVGATTLAVALGVVGLVVTVKHTPDAKAAYATPSDPNIIRIDVAPVSDPAGWGVPADSHWVNVVLKDVVGVDRVAAEWQSEMIAHADRIAAEANGAHPIVGVTYFVQRSNGTLRGLSGHVLEPGTPSSSPSNSSVESAIRSVASADGLVLQSIRFDSDPVIGSSVRVVAEVSNALGFLEGHDFIGEVDALAAGTVPMYVELLDANGRPVAAQATVPIGSATITWKDPSMGCVGMPCPPTAPTSG